ncbi:DEP domain-containing protein 1A-like isoform X1 [Apostichopus japonicus]|uniref:DEP domain-containing protein 1A-like isoform X1 n=1 Tax=Stichopus japonicus TaxID=307972 RepID=UPI003AB6E484
MDKSKGMIGPFRATRMWNEIVSDFRSGIPTKRHRWKMRFYDDCFMSNEAVDWLHNYLQTNENYGPWVTREQAIQLLEKFAQSKIIESVKPFKGGSKEPFEDNGSLYKLVHLSPMKKLRSALHGKNNLRSLTPSPKKTRTRGPMRPLSLNSKLMNAAEEENWNIKSKLLSGNREKTDEKVIGPSQRRRLSKPGVLKRSRSLGEMDKQTSSSSVASVSSVKGHGQDESRARSQKTEAVWKTAALARLKRLLWLFTLEGVVDETTIKGKSIIHNSTQLSRSGVVVISDKTDDLPHWVLSAMKCIANWPQNQDSELPSYDGFEKDVFHTISNYFQSLQEPLMTFNLYNLINQAYVLGKGRDDGTVKPPASTSISKDPLPSKPGKYNRNGSGTTDSGRRKDVSKDNKRRFGSQERIFCITKSRSVGHLHKAVTGKEDGVGPTHKSNNIYIKKMHRSTAKVSRAQSLRIQSMQKRTASDSHFLSNGRPRSFAGYSPQKNEYENVAQFLEGENFSPGENCRRNESTPSEPKGLGRTESRRSFKLSKKFGSASDLFHKLIGKKGAGSKKGLGGSVPDVVASTFQETQKRSKSLSPQTQPLISTEVGSTSLAMTQSPSDSCPSGDRTQEQRDKRVSPPYPAPLRATLSVSEIVRSNPNSANSSPTFFQDSQSSLSGTAFFRGKSVSSVELRSSTPIFVDGETSAREDVPSLQLEANKSYCEEAMRLALLLLPPPNRRKLHLLFKMMSKVERNEELQLYPQESKRDLLLHTFTRCILRTESEVDFDEAYANRIVSYLLDNFNTILASSAALTADVSERVNLEQGSQYNAKAGSSVVYCKQITKEEYQNDIQTTSQKAMSDLLETIIADKNMEVKEKKKRLKVFQKAYPEIYKKRLPTAASEAELFPTKPKIKQPMLKRSFTRLKPIR